MTPIAGKGYSGSAIHEQIVTLGLGSVGITMVIGLAIVVYGLVVKGDA
jgi:hypothetical protein